MIEICRRVDRLPLAIELAAARVRVLGTTQLLSRLERRLPLLTSGTRDAPERQRTLRATIEWSYDLLDPDEQRLVARLAVFAGSFDLAAAEIACGATVDGLERLVEQSLLRRWASGRLGMLETIREFCLERLERDPEHDRLRRRHAEWYLTLAKQTEQAVWFSRLAAEIDNLRAALAWSLEQDIALGLELASTLSSSVARAWATSRADRLA